MNADENAINQRFWEGMGLMLDWNAGTDATNPPLVVIAENAARQVDASQVYGMFVVEPGDSSLAQSDGTMLSLGVATFMLVAPKGDLAKAESARVLRDQFFALFRNWRSPDLCLSIRKMGPVTLTSKDDHRIAARIYWQSLRS